MTTSLGRPRKNPKLNGPFNKLIVKRMQQLKIDKVDEFAKYAKISRTVMHGLIQGRLSDNGTWVKPSVDTLFQLAKALNYPAHDLLYRLDPDLEQTSDIPVIPVPSVAVQILGLVGAGPGQETPLTETTLPVSVEFAAGKNLVGYCVRGDSMAGGKHPIYNGDFVLVNANDKGVSGQVVVARLRDGSMVCKAFKSDRFGTRLISTNPLYTNSAPPIISALDVEEIIGRVVRVVQDVESLES
jgi:repressor LexA